jgi:hypothetical protein
MNAEDERFRLVLSCRAREVSIERLYSSVKLIIQINSPWFHQHPKEG